MSLSIGQRFAGFSIESELGRGGFATVYGCTDSNGNAVALKVLHPNSDASIVARFERELELLGRLRSPQTVRLYGHGRTEGIAWAAFELIAGEDLRDFLDTHGTLSPPAVRSILSQVASSLVEAHDIGLVHRDLKPENIRVRPRR